MARLAQTNPVSPDATPQTQAQNRASGVGDSRFANLGRLLGLYSVYQKLGASPTIPPNDGSAYVWYESGALKAAFEGTTYTLAPAGGGASVNVSESGGAQTSVTDIDFGSGFDLTVVGATGDITLDDSEAPLSGLAKLVGRAGGQTLQGGTAASENLTLQSTAHATKGYVKVIDPTAFHANGQSGVNSTVCFDFSPDDTTRPTLMQFSTPGSGSWSPSSDAAYLQVTLTPLMGAAGTASITGLNFGPSIIGGDFLSTLVGVQSQLSGGSPNAANDIIGFKSASSAAAGYRIALRQAGFSAAHAWGGPGAVARLSGYEFAPTAHNANLGYLDHIGFRVADPTTSMRTAERLIGLQIDEFVTSANGEQWPFYYGLVTHIAPDKVWYYNGAATTYTDNTTEAGTPGGTDFTLLANNTDFLYIGTTSPTQFNRLLFGLKTLGASKGALTWQYYNGAWVALTVTDNTSSFSSRGASVSFTTPTDWATTTINGTTCYWVRVSCANSTGTTPTAWMIRLNQDKGAPLAAINVAGRVSGYRLAKNTPLSGTPSVASGGSAYASSTTETALNSATFTIPANKLVVGNVLRITARGVYSTKVVTTPTFRARVRYGGVAGTLLGDSGAQLMGTGVTNVGWELKFDIVIVSLGATGTVEAQGIFNAATTAVVEDAEFLTNTAVVTIDTTADNALVMTGQWGTNDAANTFSVRQWIVEVLN
jgi:hypothetical protein